MSQFNIAEAKSHFSELIKKALLGEEVVIAKDNKPLLKLVPVEAIRQHRVPGSGKALVLEIAPDFDVALDDFAEYR